MPPESSATFSHPLCDCFSSTSTHIRPPARSKAQTCTQVPPSSSSSSTCGALNSRLARVSESQSCSHAGAACSLAGRSSWCENWLHYWCCWFLLGPLPAGLADCSYTVVTLVGPSEAVAAGPDWLTASLYFTGLLMYLPPGLPNPVLLPSCFFLSSTFPYFTPAPHKSPLNDIWNVCGN